MCTVNKTILTADQLRRNYNDCVVIIIQMVKRSRYSGFQIYIDYAFIAPRSLKHKTSTYIKPEFKPTFCQF